jgi:hypothetical protein
MSNEQPSPSQIRAALAMLRWEYKDLSRAADVAVDTISRICLEKHAATARIREKIRAAFELRGIEFMESDGLRRRGQEIETFEGPDRFEVFTEYLYNHLKEHGGSVCVSVTNERLFQKYRKNVDLHRQRMKALVDGGNVTGRILAMESDFKETWAQIRRMPAGAAQSSPVSFYAFGNCLALISFDHERAPYVVLHKSGPFAEAFRQSFDLAWEGAAAI